MKKSCKSYLPKAQIKGTFDPEQEQRRIEEMNIIGDYVPAGIYTGNTVSAQNTAASAVWQSRNNATTQPIQFQTPGNQSSIFFASDPSNSIPGVNAQTIVNQSQSKTTAQFPERLGQPQFYQKPETPFVNTLRMTGENAPISSYVDNIEERKYEDAVKKDSFAKRAFDFLPSGQNILLGAGVANSLLTRPQDYDRFRRNYREPGQQMSRGDWTTNQGVLQPNRLGYFDKFSVGTGSMKMGGEVEMTDDEIYEFLAAGGELEFID